MMFWVPRSAGDGTQHSPPTQDRCSVLGEASQPGYAFPVPSSCFVSCVPQRVHAQSMPCPQPCGSSTVQWVDCTMSTRTLQLFPVWNLTQWCLEIAFDKLGGNIRGATVEPQPAMCKANALPGALSPAPFTALVSQLLFSPMESCGEFQGPQKKADPS